MSISPPSDIVLDVAKAADPLRYQQAVARLAPTGSVKPDASFEEALGRLPKTGDGPAKSDPAGASAAASKTEPADAGGAKPAGKPGTAEAYRGIEAMALASFVEAMMPEKADTFFGTGNSGRIWKSMLAEQIAGEIARSGGVGIARELQGAAGANFIAADAGTPSAAASLLVSTAERNFLDVVRPEPTLSGEDRST